MGGVWNFFTDGIFFFYNVPSPGVAQCWVKSSEEISDPPAMITFSGWNGLRLRVYCWGESLACSDESLKSSNLESKTRSPTIRGWLHVCATYATAWNPGLGRPVPAWHQCSDVIILKFFLLFSPAAPYFFSLHWAFTNYVACPAAKLLFWPHISFFFFLTMGSVWGCSFYKPGLIYSIWF